MNADHHSFDVLPADDPLATPEEAFGWDGILVAILAAATFAFGWFAVANWRTWLTVFS